MPVNPPTYFLISYAISKNTKGKKIGHKEFLWIAPAPIMNQWCHMVFQLIVKFVKALQCSMANSGPYISICIGTYNVVQKEEDGKRPSGRLGMACSYIYICIYVCGTAQTTYSGKNKVTKRTLLVGNKRDRTIQQFLNKKKMLKVLQVVEKNRIQSIYLGEQGLVKCWES